MNEKIINLSIIFLMPAAYTALAGMNYAEAFGFSIGSGLLGLPIFYVLNKFFAKNQFENNSNFRKYALSIIIFSVIGIPYQISAKNKEKIEKEQEYQIGESVGKINASCRLYNTSLKKYCQNSTANAQISDFCSKDISLMVPSKMQNEIKRILQSENYSQQISTLGQQLDTNYNVAIKSPNFDAQAFCKKMEDSVLETIEANKKFITQ